MRIEGRYLSQPPKAEGEYLVEIEGDEDLFSAVRTKSRCTSSRALNSRAVEKCKFKGAYAGI